MSAWAKPGVKCVCVDDSPSIYGACDLEVGRIYVITARMETPFGVGINVAGARSKALGFHLWRFRPLVTKTQEQDVAQFRHLLTPSPIDVGIVPAGVELDA